MSRAAKLQINQRGAWRDILRFDIDQLADETEFLVGAAQMVCSSGQMTSTTMRIVTDESLPVRLMAWSAESGWKDAVDTACRALDQSQRIPNSKFKEYGDTHMKNAYTVVFRSSGLDAVVGAVSAFFGMAGALLLAGGA